MLSLWSCSQSLKTIDVGKLKHVIQQSGEVCHPPVVMAEKVIFYLYASGYLKARSLKHHLTVAATEKDEKYI
ncbi:hypothetical protein Hanom_Chr07g00616881 [Helianthus anomalus]